MPIGKIIKEGAKLVKRGRKSKRGRPKKKVEVVEKKVVKREDPTKIKKLKGESDAAFKKRRAAIRKEVRESKRETAKDISIPKPSRGARDEQGRLLSKHIPPSREEMGDKAFARRVMQNLIDVTEEGEVKNIGKYAITPEEIMNILYSRLGRQPFKQEIKEIIERGGSIRKSGGSIVKKAGGKAYKNTVSKKYGGPIGVGKALRGYGKGYK